MIIAYLHVLIIFTTNIVLYITNDDCTLHVLIIYTTNIITNNEMNPKLG